MPVTGLSNVIASHVRPRGEMDAGVFFGSEFAPEIRLKELIQVCYRLNLVRPESVLIHESVANGEFSTFAVSQMAPSINSVCSCYGARLSEKFPEIKYGYDSENFFDAAWVSRPEDVCLVSRKINRGGIVIVENILGLNPFGDEMEFSEVASGRNSEVIVDRSECDAVCSALVSGVKIPDTKYNYFLRKFSFGGFGVIYF